MRRPKPYRFANRSGIVPSLLRGCGILESRPLRRRESVSEPRRNICGSPDLSLRLTRRLPSPNREVAPHGPGAEHRQMHSPGQLPGKQRRRHRGQGLYRHEHLHRGGRHGRPGRGRDRQQAGHRGRAARDSPPPHAAGRSRDDEDGRPKVDRAGERRNHHDGLARSGPQEHGDDDRHGRLGARATRSSSRTWATAVAT